MKYIFFRYDRIGDFLMSSILINSIKKQKSNSHITVICSKKNFKYVKSSTLVDEAYCLPDNFFLRILFYFKFFAKHYNFSFVLDGKKKSIFLSLLLKSNNKILCTNKKIYQKLFKYFFHKIFLDNNNISKIDEIKKVLNHINLKFDTSYTKYSNDLRNLNKSILNIIPNKNYLLLHFDEKWIYKSYIDSYKNIQPNINELLDFLYDLVDRSNNNLVVTTGFFNNSFLNDFKLKFIKLNDNVFKIDYKNKFIFLVDDINIFNLEYIVSMSNLIITCHGASSHMANMYNKSIIDIIDMSEEIIFKKWTNHFTNYKYLHRTNFSNLSKNIINLL